MFVIKFLHKVAAIIKTVIIHNLEELAILGIVIAIRALLAFIIHWEIRMEEKAELSAEEKEEEKKIWQKKS